MFRRKRSGATEPEDLDGPVDVDGQTDGETPVGPGAEPAVAGLSARPDGPWDSTEAPQDTLERLDLGSLRVPVINGVELRVEVGPDGAVAAATLVAGESTLQVGIYAAPTTHGIWTDVAEEIAASVTAAGGTAQLEPGRYGQELHARIVGQVEGQGTVLQPARFLGVDGPRWFLRGLWTGRAALQGDDSAVLLVEAFRGIIVVRGGDAMAPREPLPMRLPKEVAAAQAQAQAEQAEQAEQEQAAKPQAPTLPERGPEITERH